MARGRYRQQQWEQRAEAIVEAMERLCAERGFGAVTMDALADEVGISKATLYQHFDSKDALLAELMLRHLDRFLASLEGSADLPPVERLRAAMRVLMARAALAAFIVIGIGALSSLALPNPTETDRPLEASRSSEPGETTAVPL